MTRFALVMGPHKVRWSKRMEAAVERVPGNPTEAVGQGGGEVKAAVERVPGNPTDAVGQGGGEGKATRFPFVGGAPGNRTEALVKELNRVFAGDAGTA